MKPSLVLFAVQLAVTGAAASLVACDKHQSSQELPAATTRDNAMAATRVTEATFAPGPAPHAIAPAPKAAPVAAQPAAEPMSCGDAAGGGASCGAEAGGCSQWDGKAAEVAKRGTPADAVWATIPVEGMSCGGCERRIIANLGVVDGVLGVEADAELGQVRVAYAKGNDQITAAARDHIAALGYQPK